MALDRIRVVLARPRSSGNVGAAARAMKNMGLGRLVLVGAPRLRAARAEAMAVHATDVLRSARLVGTLAEAVADCGLVVGTTARETAARADAAPPRALAREIVAASAVNDVALVFGPENHGLSNTDLGLCHRLLRIPASSAYGSLNLAQAVLVCAYEIHLAARASDGASAARRPGPGAAARLLAPSARLELMYAKLEAALGRIGFLHAQNAGHMMRTFRRVLGRAALDDREARVFLGVARQVEWYAARGGAPAALTGERRAASGTHASRRARAARRPESIRSRVVVARPDNWGAPG